ncbi:MAG: HAD family phosphatase [Clostridia bacterium]|nr:HAD family phosphatase [Clostridia bacterium]
MLLFFDIDGTIFDDQRRLPASVKPAMEAARANGHQLFINTGRTLCNKDHRLDDFPLDGWIMGCGTRVIYRGETLQSSEYGLEQTLRLRNIFLGLDIPVVYECDTAMYFEPKGKTVPQISGFREFAERFGIARDAAEDDPEFRMVKMFCFAEEKKIRDLERRTEDAGMPYQAIHRGPDAWEIVQGRFSKGTGIDFLRDKLGAGREECYAFGDSMNDYAMFRHAGHSIAMGNATEDVKAVCSHVTDRPENDGIAKALKHFGII